MERPMNLAVVVAASAKKAAAKQVLTDEMKARNGRRALPKPGNLKNNLPEGNNKPPGPYADDGMFWYGLVPDLTMARALFDAGYMPLSEYARLYSFDDGA